MLSLYLSAYSYALPLFTGLFTRSPSSSQAHAGKTSQSSFNKDHTVAKGPYLDDVLPHVKYRSAGDASDAAVATPAGIPTTSLETSSGITGAPWQKDQVSAAQGIR
jgi:hypothetical protein